MPPVRDLALSGAFAIALQLDIWLLEEPRGPRWATVVSALVLAAALMLRRSRPLVMVAVASGALVAQALADGWLTSMLTTAVAAMIVTFSAALHLERRRAVVGAALFLAAALVDTALSELDGADVASDLVFTSVVVVALPSLAGRALRERNERARELEELTRQLAEEREQRAMVAVLDERNRIAREMHDVVAHSVSLMVVQAGAARRMIGVDADRARTALLAVESAGRDALAELRRVLGLLRGGPEPLALTPQPGTAQLGKLVEGIRELGLDVDMAEYGAAQPLPPGVELTVFRVVQEALTNAVKHAGRASARVELRWDCDELEVAVVDDGPGAPAGAVSTGHGLAGMRERVSAYGGRVDAGSAPGGGFAVRARIPLDRSPG
ncbi:MAG TPA: sensor histidine kinase [Mycobacteriales bacterium]|nr:sensor histidine kinase [Mycobacteriales bacterium]